MFPAYGMNLRNRLNRRLAIQERVELLIGQSAM
jgi:hypothetical protein